MNLKTAKRLRRQINEAVAPFGLTVASREYAEVVVSSRHIAHPRAAVHTAVQLRLKKDCPREVYKRLKLYVTRKSA